jgi:predicted nucleic acid-binding protein
VIAFLDTSALVKRYIDERGSEIVRRLFRSRRDLAVSRLAYVESCSAVARVCREGAISDDRRDEIFERLPNDLTHFASVVEPSRRIYARAAELRRAHTLRAYDAMQLASCLEIRARGTAAELWAQDGALIGAARHEGLKIVTVA